MKMSLTLVIVLGCTWAFALADPSGTVRRSLGNYNVDANAITVSGLSSGGAMAVQLHVAFSETFSGVGVFAGIPYFCAKGQFIYTSYCMTIPTSINTESLIEETESFSSSGKIDDTSNLLDDKVFVFHGTSDRTVYHGTGDKVVDYYSHYVSSSNMMTVLDIASGHGFPTDGYGGSCGQTSSPFINDCGLNGAYEMLNFLLGGNLEKPTAAPGSASLSGEFYEFDQTDFISGTASSNDMDTIAYVYVPSGCVDGTTCKLHVSLHGCLQGRKWLDDEYARYTGYNEVGELNNIIIIYPQATSNLLDSNPNGCWDWWGYLDGSFGGPKYTLKTGPQMEAIYKMVKHFNAAAPATTTTTQKTTTTTAGGGTGAPYDCPFASGFFPIPNYCGPDYLSCVGDIAYIQSCPEGSVFNPIKLYCDDPNNVDCQVTQ